MLTGDAGPLAVGVRATSVTSGFVSAAATREPTVTTKGQLESAKALDWDWAYRARGDTIAQGWTAISVSLSARV